jgi:hypothetical protein
MHREIFLPEFVREELSRSVAVNAQLLSDNQQIWMPETTRIPIILTRLA